MGIDVLVDSGILTSAYNGSFYGITFYLLLLLLFNRKWQMLISHSILMCARLVKSTKKKKEGWSLNSHKHKNKLQEEKKISKWRSHYLPWWLQFSKQYKFLYSETIKLKWRMPLLQSLSIHDDLGVPSKMIQCIRYIPNIIIQYV